MAKHEIPVDGVKHIAHRDCPCGVTTRRDPGPPARTVYVHTDQAPREDA